MCAWDRRYSGIADHHRPGEGRGTDVHGRTRALSSEVDTGSVRNNRLVGPDSAFDFSQKTYCDPIGEIACFRVTGGGFQRPVSASLFGA